MKRLRRLLQLVQLLQSTDAISLENLQGRLVGTARSGCDTWTTADLNSR